MPKAWSSACSAAGRSPADEVARPSTRRGGHVSGRSVEPASFDDAEHAEQQGEDGFKGHRDGCGGDGVVRGPGAGDVTPMVVDQLAVFTPKMRSLSRPSVAAKKISSWSRVSAGPSASASIAAWSGSGPPLRLDLDVRRHRLDLPPLLVGALGVKRPRSMHLVWPVSRAALSPARTPPGTCPTIRPRTAPGSSGPSPYPIGGGLGPNTGLAPDVARYGPFVHRPFCLPRSLAALFPDASSRSTAAYVRLELREVARCWTS